MCGIAGFYGKPCGPKSPGIVARQMADRLAHRGPDDSGVWVDPDLPLAMAHRRLSILDLSTAGHQPMHSASGRWVLIYNGEVYNHLALRADLEAEKEAPTWRGNSDTETLLACIEAWGVDAALVRSVGMFALAAWDRRERALWLSRDRMGEKPLYYGWQNGTFLFGSELKALTAHPAFRPEIDRSALALLLRHNYVPTPYSIYQSIRKLPAGGRVKLELGSAKHAPNNYPEPVAYWSLSEAAERGIADPFQGSTDEALEELERRLLDAVNGQMLSDVPLGALLSGGLDSSLVTSLMQAQSSGRVRTFTIGFSERDYDEASHARAIAAHLGTDHTELRLTGADALALVPQLPAIYDEPFADSSQLPTHLVMQLARRHVTVALSGDGGDESFGGYNRYQHAPRIWRRLGWMHSGLRKVLEHALTVVPPGTANRLAGPLAARVGIAQPGDKAHKLGQRLSMVSSVDDFYLALTSEWAESEPVVAGGEVGACLLHDRSRWPMLENPAARMMAVDSMTYLPDDILVKVDRAAMAVSLETRALFLDYRVVEFAWSLPMHMKIRGGQGKWILRRLLERHVPSTLFERPKMGFGIPLDDWLRGPLREWAGDLLDGDRLRREAFLQPEPILKTWQAHLKGDGSYGHRLWSVLMFQAWLAEAA